MLYDIIVRSVYVLNMKKVYILKYMTKEECKKFAMEYGIDQFKKDYMIVESSGR